MKKIYLSTALLFNVMLFSQVGVGTVAPEGALDVTSSTNGFIPPRVALLTSLTTPTITNPQGGALARGTMVYNTTNGSGFTPGYYYWETTPTVATNTWVRLNGGPNTNWSLTGNAGTTAGTNYIGTTDAQDLRFKTQGIDRLNISNTNGQLQSYYTGAAGTPAYSWNSDPDTGMLHPAVNELSLSTGGTERVRIDEVGAIGVGTTTPQGALDVIAGTNNYGFVAPRVALTASNAQAPVTNPQTGAIPAGTVVYNTATAGVAPNNVGPGLYYWDGTRWIAFAGSPGGLDWSLTGNSSTTPGLYATPGPNYIGTSDNTPIHFSVNGTPRMRITTSGNAGIGMSSTVSTRLSVDSALATDGTIAATSIGSDSSFIIPTASFKNNSTTNYATAIIANTPNAAGAANPNIAIRAASGNTSYVAPAAAKNIAISANSTDTAIYAITEGTTDTSRRAGEFRTNDTGISTDSDSNDPTAYLAGYANAVDINNGGNIRNVRYGGYFQSSTNSFAYVGAKLSANYNPGTGNTTNFKIIGAGAVSTIVSSDKTNDSKKIMFAPEAPEVLFEDYGTGQLTNGVVKIDIDPIFVKNIFVDEKHPLKVFIQLEGDCNGVYVTNKTKNGFTVKELNNGNSNVKFSWHIVGNRADEIESNGEKTTYQSLRYPDAPGPLAPTEIESKKLKPNMIDTEGSNTK